jgi:N-acetylmuramoyl-L-alanine amidase
MPVVLCCALAVGIVFPAMSPEAEAGKSNSIISALAEDGFITVAALAANDSHSDAPISILVDNKEVEFASPPLLIGSTTYVPLYDFSRLMGAAAMTQDEDSTTIFLPKLQIVAVADTCYITANGRYLYVPDLCKMVNNVMYVPVRTLSRVFGAKVKWNSDARSISVTPALKPISSGDSFYDETDVYWLSRIINAESRGEPMAGKIAVGNVVLNRVSVSSYPDTVHGVIFDRRSGIQFSPAYSGSIKRTPSEDCIIAAKLALDGADVVGDSLYFNASRLRSTWASRNRTYVATIGNHSFYA